MTDRKYPNPDDVRRAFLASGRRHLILTGSRGAGKTTLLRGLCGQNTYPGITTKAIPMTAVTMTDNLTGEAARIAVYDPTLPGTERKMRPTEDGFSVFGVKLLERCVWGKGDFVVIDEIGYLELGCEAYLCALGKLAAQKRLICVVRNEVLGEISRIIPTDASFVLHLDCPPGDVGCVIMASGMGKRFGGNKLMADFGGEPMIARILASTDGIFSRRVVVTRHSDVADYCTRRGVDVVLHDLPDRNDTVRLGLDAVGKVSACMFCPADQPLLQKNTVAALTMAAATDGQCIYRAAWEDTVGAPVVFPAWCFEELRTLPTGKGGGYVAKRYPQYVKTVSVSDPAELDDADTKERLEELLQAWENCCQR